MKKIILLLIFLSISLTVQADYVDVKVQADFNNNSFRFVPVEESPIEQPPIEQPPVEQPPVKPPVLEDLMVWVNTGEDKVVREELRLSKGQNIKNSVWDGEKIRLFGAKNEVISFNTIIEAPSKDLENISVEFNLLSNNDGDMIASNGDDPFNYVGRNIELFYVRYLEIKGLSQVAYHVQYDERHIPEDLRRPIVIDENGDLTRFAEPNTGWSDRPNANKSYPDIAIPMEVQKKFNISANTNQSIWADIYIPKTSNGLYTGEFSIYQDGILSKKIPVELEVLNFELPDKPTAKTALYISEENIYDRFFGYKFPNWGNESVKDQAIEARKVIHNYYRLAKRHKIDLIDDGARLEWAVTYNGWEKDTWEPIFDGTAFSKKNGYDGVGVGLGTNIYSIATYGKVDYVVGGSTKDVLQRKMRWYGRYFSKYPDIEVLLYLKDEPYNIDDLEWVERRAQWMKENEEIGRRVKSLVVTDLLRTDAHIPSVDIAFYGFLGGMHDTETYTPVFNKWVDNPDKEVWAYNGWRPRQGTFMIEDEGVSPRMMSWEQYKHNLDRWFYWSATAYKNPSHQNVETNVFNTAWTFGRQGNFHGNYGVNSTQYGNGDGVLIYPGTDLKYPEDNYGLSGAFASLRLKYWRRGIQDHDYLVLASEKNSERVNEIVNSLIPKVGHEVGIVEVKDPTYTYSDISWNTNPDIWESYRRELANIITGE